MIQNLQLQRSVNVLPVSSPDASAWLSSVVALWGQDQHLKLHNNETLYDLLYIYWQSALNINDTKEKKAFQRLTSSWRMTNYNIQQLAFVHTQCTHHCEKPPLRDETQKCTILILQPCSFRWRWFRLQLQCFLLKKIFYMPMKKLEWPWFRIEYTSQVSWSIKVNQPSWYCGWWKMPLKSMPIHSSV